MTPACRTVSRLRQIRSYFAIHCGKYDKVYYEIHPSR
jgi:hypothetical protein